MVTATERWVAVEMPVQLSYSGIPFGVMMASPGDLEDFALGFSFTEGIIERFTDIRAIDVVAEPDHVRLRIDLVPERLHAHLARRRVMVGRTGCGVCGIDDVKALPRAARPTGPAPIVPLAAIRRALAALDRHQPLNEATHAVHAAAWADLAGAIVCTREDVGRHNALDKLVGACLRGGIDPAGGFCIITSRCSYEMVEKAAAFGARTLVAISAPTSLALDRARHLDLALAGVARKDAVTVFCGFDRIPGSQVVSG